MHPPAYPCAPRTSFVTQLVHIAPIMRETHAVPFRDAPVCRVDVRVTVVGHVLDEVVLLRQPRVAEKGEDSRDEAGGLVLAH